MTHLVQQDSSPEHSHDGMSKGVSSSSFRSTRSSDSGIYCDRLSSSGDSNSMIQILDTQGAVCNWKEMEKVKEEEVIFTTGITTADGNTMAQRHSVATNTSDEHDSSTLLPADDCDDSTVILRSRSLPAADLRHKIPSKSGRARWKKALSFTGTSGSSNEPLFVLAENEKYEEKTHMTGIYSPSPSPSPSASRMEPAEPSFSPNGRNMVHRESQTESPTELWIKSAEDNSTPTEQAILYAIKQHSDKFSQWINWNELAIYLEKYGLLDSESRTNLLTPCSLVSSRKSHYFLYEVLPTKGSSPYSLFFKALNEEKHHLGHTELVSLIRKHQIL